MRTLLCSCVALILAIASPGRALGQTEINTESSPETSIGAAAMQAAMADYFRGERLGGVAFATVGAGSLVAGGLMVRSDSDVGRGMSYPLLGLGAVQAIVGTIVIFQSGPRIRRHSDQIRETPSSYRDKEFERAGGILRTMRWLLVTEAVIALGGAGMAIYGERTDRGLLTGIGLGLTIEATILFVQDWFVRRRALRYHSALRDFHVAVSPADQSYLVMYSGTF